MLRSHLDHLVVVAPGLEAGAAYVQSVLGVGPQPGGEHPRMGTHNRFLHLGGMCYLEVIAVDPKASHPGRPRWFQLDDLGATAAPRLATWVVRTNDIHAAAAASPVAYGTIETMTRGEIEWLMTVPEDGCLYLDGIVPVLIQWPDGVHPTRTLADSGCRLVSLRGFHPAAAQVNRLLAAIGFEGPASIAPTAAQTPPHLAAGIGTPSGTRELRGA